LKNNVEYRYYIDEENKKRLLHAKIRYFIYGGAILAFGILLFILEMLYSFGITVVLDYFISVSMITDMIIGIIFILKGIFLKNGIKANFFFNMSNSYPGEDKPRVKPGLIRYLSLIPVAFNISLIVFYALVVYYNVDSINFVMIFSLSVAILLNILCIMAVISLDGENQIYDRIE